MKIFSQGVKIVLAGLFLIGSISVFAQTSSKKSKKHHSQINKDSVKGAGYYFDAGNDKAKAGDCVSAIDLYDRCISMSPNTFDAYYNRAYCKMQLNDYEAAVEDYTTCMRLYKKPYSDALFLRGSCFNQLKRYDMAIADFTKALEVSSNPDIYAGRGFAYMQKRDFENALSDYTDAIAKDTTKTEWYGQRAMCQYRLRHLKEAIADAEKFLVAKPSSTEIVEVKLRAEIEMKNYPDALTTSEKLITIEKSPKAYYYKGLVEFSQGKYKDGVSDFSSAINLDTSNADAYYSRSLCYFGLNDDTNACKDILKAKRLGFPNLEGKINIYCKGQKQ